MAYDAQAFTVDPLLLTTPRARLEYLRDFLLRLPTERFNMDVGATPDILGGRHCGTPSCIAGWAKAVFEHQCNGLTHVGVSKLGLTEDEAYNLFYPGGSQMADQTLAWEAVPADAAAVLTHLINTGEVDWSVARKAGL